MMDRETALVYLRNIAQDSVGHATTAHKARVQQEIANICNAVGTTVTNDMVKDNVPEPAKTMLHDLISEYVMWTDIGSPVYRILRQIYDASPIEGG